jgi:uridine phosphorylase
VGILGDFGIGAPAAVTQIEELVAFGARRFVAIGTAGGLQPALTAGELVVCDRAIRDEGTSFHYLPASRCAYPDPALTARLRAQLEQAGHRPHLGASWTIDAPYRETREEIRQHQRDGVLTVEMEASALFAVGAYRKVEVAAAFTISDFVAADPWQPHFDAVTTERGLQALLNSAITMLNGT